MGNEKYIRTQSLEQLKNKGFQLLQQNKEGDLYSYKFPLYKYKAKTLIECEIIVFSDTKDVRINIIDIDNGSLYSGYYTDYSGYDFMKNILNRKIDNKLKYLGIKEKKIGE